MAYELKIVEDKRFVELRFHGRGDHDEHIAARDEAFEVCRKRKIDRILVDIHDAFLDMSARELLEFGKSLQDSPDLQNIHFAVIIRENDEAADLTAAVAQTKNVKLRVFLTEEDACNWLMN